MYILWIKRVYEVLSSIGLHTAGNIGFTTLPPVTEELCIKHE